MRRLSVLLTALLVVGAASAEAAPFGSRALKPGMRGKDVRALQGSLTAIGFSTPIDGSYGKLTIRSVKKLEHKKRWPVNGVVSRKDAARIKTLVSKRRTQKPTDLYYHWGLTAPTVTVTASKAGDARLDVVDTNTATAMLSYQLSFSGPGDQPVAWAGNIVGGLAPDSSYLFVLVDGSANAAITSGQTKPFKYRQHAFPAPGTHSYGGAGSRFGAPRAGHTHQGQDVSAACGEKLYAAQGGTVTTKSYQASGAGYYLVIKGAISGESYVYMHMKKPSWLVAGQAVHTGEQIGKVGNTGASSGCHLHFEIWTAPGWYLGGVPYDPLPVLQYWDAYS